MKQWLLALLITFGLVAGGYWAGAHNTSNDYERRILNEYITTQQASENQRSAVQASLDETAKEHQEELAGIEGSTDRIIADLRKSNNGLRVKLATSGASEGVSRCEPDGRAELHPATLKGALAVTEQATIRERAYIKIIKKLQGE